MGPIMHPTDLRVALAAEMRRTSIRAVALRLGVSARALGSYVIGAGKLRLAAIIERRASELGWPPAADRGEP